MKNGGMTKVISTSIEEHRIFRDIERVDGWLSSLRETIRQGEMVRLKMVVVAGTPGWVRLQCSCMPSRTFCGPARNRLW